MLIPRQVFAVSKLAARESTRYAINGVNVERVDGQCVATTTDGRRLISVTWSDEDVRADFPPDCGDVTPVDDFQTIVSRSQWDEAAKLIPKPAARLKPVLANCLLDENSANGTVTMSATDLGHATGRRRVSDLSAEEHFPKYQDVIPAYDIGHNAVAIGVNPRLLAETLCAVEATATDEEHKGVRLIVPTDPRCPMVIDSEANGVEATAVLMPVRLNVKPWDRVDTSPVGMARTMVELLKRFVACGGHRRMRKGNAAQREFTDDVTDALLTLGETYTLQTAGIIEPAESEAAA